MTYRLSVANKFQWIFFIKIQQFHPRKWIWKYRLQNRSHFVSTSMCWLAFLSKKPYLILLIISICQDFACSYVLGCELVSSMKMQKCSYEKISFKISSVKYRSQCVKCIALCAVTYLFIQPLYYFSLWAGLQQKYGQKLCRPVSLCVEDT